MRTYDALIIGFDHSNGDDNTVLIVGRKKEGGAVEVINAFAGPEAVELYNKLTANLNKEKME